MSDTNPYFHERSEPGPIDPAPIRLAIDVDRHVLDALVPTLQSLAASMERIAASLARIEARLVRMDAQLTALRNGVVGPCHE